MPRPIKIIDRGWNRIAKMFRAKTGGVVAHVGIQGSEATEDHGGITNAALLAIHEHGAPSVGIPERAPLRSTFEENQRKYTRRIAKAAKAGLDGKDLENEMYDVGETYRKDVTRKIRSGAIKPPLKPATVARKGKSTPLLDTGQMVDALTTEVKR